MNVVAGAEEQLYGLLQSIAVVRAVDNVSRQWNGIKSEVPE